MRVAASRRRGGAEDAPGHGTALGSLESLGAPNKGGVMLVGRGSGGRV